MLPDQRKVLESVGRRCESEQLVGEAWQDSSEVHRRAEKPVLF